MRRSKRAAVITAAFLTLGVFAPPSASSQEILSQVVCEATGFTSATPPSPSAGPLDSRFGFVTVSGSGVCVKPAVVPGGAVVYNLAFSGQGSTLRTGPCLAGVIGFQEILVTQFLTPAPVGPPGASRIVQHLWTTELNLGSTVTHVPSVYPPVHFQIRQPNARYSLRGAGVYTETIGPPCNTVTLPPPAPPGPVVVPSVFAYSFTGGDLQP